MRREFLQLAKTYNPEKNNVAGWCISEKLDGTRCLWDGGITRGMKTVDVPWASIIDPKTGQMKKSIKPIATGLWSRYGNPIIAPDEFLDMLPPVMLDGELWAGRGNFKLCRSICGRKTPDSRFMPHIKFMVYGCPTPSDIFIPGEIKNQHFHRTITEDTFKWVSRHFKDPYRKPGSFDSELDKLPSFIDSSKNLAIHDQFRVKDNDHAEEFFNGVLDLGGEGIVMRRPDSIWYPKRMSHLLKCKPEKDDEGTLVGFTSGRATDKGSKYLGKIGALILDYNGKRLELSGMTDKKREFARSKDVRFAEQQPGKDMPVGTQSKYFEVGQRITFKYRELSDVGIPIEARYWRRRDNE